MKKKLRQILKMTVQNIVLPVAYRLCCLQKIQPGLVILADGHCTKRPERMQLIYEGLQQRNYDVMEWYVDFQSMNYIKAMGKMLDFMKCYARANYVVISDNFLPVSSCKKRKETYVVQLWHGCGAFKKFGYDTEDDIPASYVGNVFRNYDLVPVSGPRSIEPFTSAMRLEKDVCQPVGVSATDVYFDDNYNQECREAFYDQYPETQGKSILLWAPTFRGNAGDPKGCGVEMIQKVTERLGENWHVIIKYHPHMEAKGMESTTDIPTERLLPVVDLLITDYSSVIFPYAIYKKPILFFAPDLDTYWSQRGFYLEYEELPGRIAKNEDELLEGIEQVDAWFDGDKMHAFYCEYMVGCDGTATERILDKLDTKRYKS